MNRKILLAVALWVCICSVQAQEREKHLYFGLLADYVTINDQTIGDIPLKGVDAGLRIGFDNMGRESQWRIGLRAGIGFLNAYNFPDIGQKMANRYSGSLAGEYLHRIGPQNARLQVYIGGQIDLSAYYNQILAFSNSETNYFFHGGLAPKVRLEYPFKMLKKDYRITGSFSYDMLAVVARPSYSMPFPDDRMDNVRLASLGGYGMARTHVGLWHRMGGGNAWEVAYDWQYDFDCHLNNVQQAVHSLSFVLYMNL